MCKDYSLDCQEEKMGCKGCAFREKSADEMFTAIGYEKKKEGKHDVIYEYNNYFYIEFFKISKTVRIRRKSKSWFKSQEYVGLQMDELKAINKKVEELGWN